MICVCFSSFYRYRRLSRQHSQLCHSCHSNIQRSVRQLGSRWPLCTHQSSTVITFCLLSVLLTYTYMSLCSVRSQVKVTVEENFAKSLSQQKCLKFIFQWILGIKFRKLHIITPRVLPVKKLSPESEMVWCTCTSCTWCTFRLDCKNSEQISTQLSATQ